MRQDGTRREAIVETMIRVSGSKGYLATSVADVVGEAHASRATFYKHFADREDCFLAAFDAASERVIEEARDGCEGRYGWLDRVRAGLAAVVELLATDPELARVVVVEVAAAGAEARRRQWAAIGELARMLDAGPETPSDVKLPATTGLMAVSAVVGLLFDELRDIGTADRLTLLPELEFALLVPFIGPRAAAPLHMAAADGQPAGT